MIFVPDAYACYTRTNRLESKMAKTKSLRGHVLKVAYACYTTTNAFEIQVVQFREAEVKVAYACYTRTKPK